ncbi:MAG: hypothetical protein QM784_22935 [Polyangiaceae bacterium]
MGWDRLLCAPRERRGACGARHGSHLLLVALVGIGLADDATAAVDEGETVAIRDSGASATDKGTAPRSDASTSATDKGTAPRSDASTSATDKGTAPRSDASTSATDGGTMSIRLDVVLLDVSEPPTFRSRLESWFPEGTALTVSLVQPELPACAARFDAQRVLAQVTFPSLDQAIVTFAYCDAQSGQRRFVRREIPLPGGLDELGQERLAQIVHSGTMALIEGRVDEVGTVVEGPAITEVPARDADITPHRPNPNPDEREARSAPARTSMRESSRTAENDALRAPRLQVEPWVVGSAWATA